MPQLRFVPASEVSPELLQAAFTQAFSDYLVGAFSLGPEVWPAFLVRQGIVLTHSRAALEQSMVRAFVYAAPRPECGRWRLATMGVVPAIRRMGVGAAMLDEFIARAIASGQKAVELECFEQNERAMRLYTSRGFEPVHPLYGYVREPHQPLPRSPVPNAEEPPVRVLGREDAFARLDAITAADGWVPFQVTSPSLRASAVVQARACGEGLLFFSVTSEKHLTIHALIDPTPQQTAARVLGGWLLRTYPALRIVVPQLLRPDLGGNALLDVGFRRQPLSQLLMRRSIYGGAGRG